MLMSIFVSWFPMLLLIGVWVFFMRQMQGGGKGGAFSFGKSKARMLDEDTNTVTFADVAGCDEAKEEVKEMVDSCATLQVPEAGWPHSARRAAGRLAG
jgi:cell division protease FtsH